MPSDEPAPPGASAETMAYRWRRYLQPFEPIADAVGSGQYQYPTTDIEVDNNVDSQDAGKRAREQQLIRDALAFDWEVAIDFGCGTGAQFPCFDHPRKSCGLLVGIEPDAPRARQARASAGAVRHAEAIVAEGDANLLAQAPPELLADAAVCNQILGHVSSTEREVIVAALHRVLRSGSRTPSSTDAAKSRRHKYP